MGPFSLFAPRDQRPLLREEAEALAVRLREALTRQSFSASLHGEHATRRGGEGHDFWQYRDFQSGDASRGIDWKQSAKSDRILVRQKEQHVQRRTTLWLQNDAGMHFGGKYAAGGVIALSLALLSAARHDPVVFAGAGAVSPDDLTDILLKKKTLPDENFSGRDIWLIGDFIDGAGFASQIPHSRTVHLVQILSPEEIDFPYSGRIVFEHPDARDSELVMNAGSIRRLYQARLQAHCHGLKREAETRGWTYSFIRAGEDAFLPLLGALGGEAL